MLLFFRHYLVLGISSHCTRNTYLVLWLKQGIFKYLLGNKIVQTPA